MHTKKQMFLPVSDSRKQGVRRVRSTFCSRSRTWRSRMTSYLDSHTIPRLCTWLRDERIYRTVRALRTRLCEPTRAGELCRPRRLDRLELAHHAALLRFATHAPQEPLQPTRKSEHDIAPVRLQGNRMLTWVGLSRAALLHRRRERRSRTLARVSARGPRRACHHSLEESGQARQGIDRNPGPSSW